MSRVVSTLLPWCTVNDEPYGATSETVPERSALSGLKKEATSITRERYMYILTFSSHAPRKSPHAM